MLLIPDASIHNNGTSRAVLDDRYLITSEYLNVETRNNKPVTLMRCRIRIGFLEQSWMWGQFNVNILSKLSKIYKVNAQLKGITTHSYLELARMWTRR